MEILGKQIRRHTHICDKLMQLECWKLQNFMAELLRLKLLDKKLTSYLKKLISPDKSVYGVIILVNYIIKKCVTNIELEEIKSEWNNDDIREFSEKYFQDNEKKYDIMAPKMEDINYMKLLKIMSRDNKIEKISYITISELEEKGIDTYTKQCKYIENKTKSMGRKYGIVILVLKEFSAPVAHANLLIYDSCKNYWFRLEPSGVRSNPIYFMFDDTMKKIYKKNYVSPIGNCFLPGPQYYYDDGYCGPYCLFLLDHFMNKSTTDIYNDTYHISILMEKIKGYYDSLLH